MHDTCEEVRGVAQTGFEYLIGWRGIFDFARTLQKFLKTRVVLFKTCQMGFINTLTSRTFNNLSYGFKEDYSGNVGENNFFVDNIFRR